MLEKVTESFHRGFALLERYDDGARAAAEVTGHVRRTFTSPHEFTRDKSEKLFGEKGAIYLTPGGSEFTARARFSDKYAQAVRLQTRVFLTKYLPSRQGQLILVDIQGYAQHAKTPLFLLHFGFKPGQAQPLYAHLIYDPPEESLKRMLKRMR